jgi:hypothetical protein
LCNFDGGEESDAKILCMLFKIIALEALKSDSPKLSRIKVTNLRISLKSEKAKELMDVILHLFSKEDDGNC